MPNEEHTRSEYLAALLNQKKTINANNGSLLNPSVQNGADLGSMASLDTSFETVGSSSNGGDIAQFDVEKAKDSESDNGFLNAMNKVFGFVDEIAAKFGAGFVGAFEGVLDFGATAIGALGDATGWYDSDPFTNWAEQDIATAAAEWTKTYANFTPWGIIGNIANGNYADSQYWSDAFEGLKDIGGVALFMDNELDHDYREDADKYYSFNDDLETGFGQFLGGAAYSIGFMLPSIMTGGASAAAGASSAVAKGLSLASMGLSAAGKSSEEALGGGASAGQALGYGAASGAVEIVSEIVVGKALEGAAKALHLESIVGGLNKVNGVEVSKELVKKSTAKELCATMFEEGAEEVFSDLLAPICESIYKGSDSLKQYGESDYYKDMGMSFLSGAFVGGLSSGFQSATTKAKYGVQGAEILEFNQELCDLREQYKEAKINGTDTTEIENKVQQVTEKILTQFESMQNSTNPKVQKQFKNLMNGYFGAIKNAKTYSQTQIDSIQNERISAFKSEVSQPVYKAMTDSINKMFKSSGVNANIQWATAEEMNSKNFTKYGLKNKFVDTDGNVRAFYESSTGSIIINEAYKNEVGEIIKHEGISHAILDSDINTRKTIIDVIESDSKLNKEYHKYDKQIEKEYGKDSKVLESERLATFLESQLKDYKTFSKVFSNTSLTKSKVLSLLNRIKSKFNKVKGFNKTLVNNLTKAIQTLQNTKAVNNEQVAYSKKISNNKGEKANGTKQNDLGKILKENRRNNSESPYIRDISRSIWKRTNGQEAQRILERVLPKEDLSRKSSGRLDVIQDENGNNYIVGAPNYTYNSLQNIYNNLESKSDDFISLKIKQMLSEHKLEDFEKAKLTITSADGMSSLTVTESGDIVNVVNLNPAIRGWVNRALKIAIDNGGISMDCYNLNEGINLPYNYSKQGFVPVSQTPYNNEFVDERIRDKFDKLNGNNGILFLKYVGENTPQFATYEQMKAFIDKSGNVLTFDGENGWDNAENERNNFDRKNFERKMFEQFGKDSEGNSISKEQYSYFKNSKALDEKGNLKVLYHGTYADFSVFNKSLSQDAFFFTDNESNAISYAPKFNGGKVLKTYLKLTNPLIIDNKGYSWDKIDVGLKTKQGITDWKTAKNLLKEGKITQLEQVREIVRSIDPFDFYSSFEQGIHYEMEQGKTLEDFEKEFLDIDNPNGFMGLIDYAENEIGTEDSEAINVGSYTEGLNTVEVPDYKNTRDIVEQAKKDGYDGVIFKNIIDYGDFSLKGGQQIANVYVAFESNQIKLTDNLKPTSNENIRYSKVLDDGYGEIKIEGQKYRVSDTSNILSALDGYAINYEDYYTEGNDYHDPHISKRYVNSINKQCEAIVDYLRNEVFDSSSEYNVKEDFDIINHKGLTELKSFLSENSLGENLQTVIDEVDNVDWDEYHTDQPDYEYIQELVDYLDELVDNEDFDKLISDYEAESKERFKPKVEETKKEEPKKESKKENLKLATPKTTTTPTKPSSPSAETFKTMQTTKDIVSVSTALIEKTLGKDYKVSLPQDFNNFSGKAFTEINNSRLYETEAKKLTNMLLDSAIKVMDSNTKKYNNVDILRNIFTATEQADLQKAVEDVIRAGTDTAVKSKATRSLEMALNKMSDIAKEYSNRLNNLRIDTNLRNNFRKQLDRNYLITEDNISRDGLAFLMKPFAELHGSQKGFSKANFASNINEVLAWYNQDTINEKNYPNLPYYDELRNKLIDLHDSLGEPITRKYTYKSGSTKEITIFGSLSAHSLQLAKECMQMIYHANNEAINRYVMESAPAAIQSYNVINTMSYGNRTNAISQLFRSYKRGFAPAYTVLRQILGGNSAVAQTLTTEYQTADNNFKIYEGSYHDAINNKLKELGIRNKLDKQIDFRGIKLTMDQAIGLYVSLNVEANKTAMNDYGVQVYDAETNRLKTLAEKGDAENLKSEIENKLESSYKQLGDWLLSTMNDSVKSEYIKWYEERFGKYNHRNEIGGIKENTYWMLNRSYQHITNVEKVLKAPNGIFSHAKSRTNNNNRVLVGGALSGFTAYVNQLGKELYLKPVYRKGISMLNTKVSKDGTTVYELLRKKVDPKDLSYLETTLEDMLGVNTNKVNDVFTGIMSRFSVAKLSLNVGTMLKQFASIWTSQIPFRQSTKAVISRMFSSEAMKSEYKTLVNELGGLKYRESDASVVKANADGLSGLSQKIANAGMIGISKVDLFTVGTGVYSLMIIGQDQFNYKIGTQENIDFVKSHWADFELSQIGNGALSKNAVARGDYGTLTRGLFGFMQGANRAALGAQIDKIDLWRRNRNVDIDSLKEKLKTAKDDVQWAKDEYEANNSEENRNAYIDAQSQVLDLETKIKDYESFKTAGGKFIPTNMVAGLVAQGIFISLVTELMKHIKGKKDWDDWDIADLGSNALLSVGVDWLPLVNTLSSMVQGYEVSVPTVDMLNQITDIISSAKDGNWKTLARQIAIIIGDSFGIPVETIYQYIYGAVNTFNPETAYEMKTALYGTSLTSATTSLKTYVENGNTNKANQMISIILNNYKYDGATDRVKTELTNLYMNGYNALPKSYMTEYTDSNGNTVSLTSSQITQFKQLYSYSDKAVRELMSVSDYSSMTQEEKAKAIKKIYDYYYEYAKAKVLGTSGSSKMSNLLIYSNGNIAISKYVGILNKISSITDSKTKTRKELVIDYINKLSNLTKQEKLLVMYLAGYSVKDSNLKSLKNYLSSKGMSTTNLKAFLGEE